MKNRVLDFKYALIQGLFFIVIFRRDRYEFYDDWYGFSDW